jgi:hypothetical protein
MEEDKTRNKKSNHLRSLIGGDLFLSGGMLRKQGGLIVLLVVLAIFYIDNRYTVQRQQIKIDKLKRELVKWKYIDLTRSSELMEISRQSKIEEYVQKNNSDLQTSTEPPFVIVQYKNEE